MSGISDKALKTGYAENKYRFNKGSELQNKEFADGSGLEMYETSLRELDPQLGRWWQADPKTDQSHESVSPYSSMNNDPIRFNDYNGDEGSSCCEFTFTWENVKNKLHQDWDHSKEFALEAVNSAGSTMNGQLNNASLGTWPTNPAQTIFNVNTDINQSASSLGQSGGLPLGSGGEQLPNAGPAIAAAGEGLALANNSLNSILTPISTVYAGKATADMAKKGADLAGITQNTERIPAPSGKAKYRVPDQLNDNSVGEVKLVDKLHFSSQIQDILAYSQKEQIPFTLYVRGGENETKFTAPLQKQLDAGKILLQRIIPGIQ
jgi:RHS repeat-associated protein